MNKTGTTRRRVRLDQLNIIPDAAQRAFDPSKLRLMTGALFDPKAVGVLIVSLRPDGQYHILDGQHRWMLLLKEGYTEWDVDVHEGLSPVEEWDLFSKYNNGRTNLTRLTTHTSWSMSGHAGSQRPEAVMAAGIDDVAVKHGFFVPRFSDRNPNALVSIEAVETIWKMGGAVLLDQVLGTVREAWGDDDERLRRGRSSNLLRGLGLVHGYHEGHAAFDRGHLVFTLADIGPFKIDSLAGDLRERNPKLMPPRAIYLTILKRYNQGRKGGAQLRAQSRSLLSSMRGQNNRFATVSDETAEGIAQMILDGNSMSEIMLRYQVSRTTIDRVKTLKRYTKTMDQARYGPGKKVAGVLGSSTKIESA